MTPKDNFFRLQKLKFFQPESKPLLIKILSVTLFYQSRRMNAVKVAMSWKILTTKPLKA
jgi:hypothetical protein